MNSSLPRQIQAGKINPPNERPEPQSWGLRPIGAGFFCQGRKKICESMRELANVVETLQLKQHVRVVRGRVLQERPDMTLKIVQKPRKVNQFAPRTA